MIATIKRVALLGAIGAVIVAFTMAFRVQKAAGPRVVYATLGELQAVHAHVRVAGVEIRGIRRVGDGEAVDTSADGRARMRLDDGTSVILDRATRLSPSESRITLDAGRLLVKGTAGARTELAAGSAVVLVGSSTLAVERAVTAGGPASTRIYCVSGEVVARVSGKEVRIQSGETADVHGEEVTVAPEKAWNDWTRGMAHPWSATGKPRPAIGELWGKIEGQPESAGTPLAVRSHEVKATLVGEVATTESRTTYFNAGGVPVVGDFRMALPPDALVTGFATGTGESLSPGRITLASDTEGASGIPTLEWAGEGWLRGKTAQIAQGQTTTVMVQYVEWLSPADGRMTYRYPMLADAVSPAIGEFHAVIDVAGVDPARIGVGAGMSIQGDTLELRRADFRPTSDLVVDLTLHPAAFDKARGYLVPSDDAAGSFLLVRAEVAPETPPLGVTLAVVVDTSQSIDAPLLDAERALVEAIIEGLGPDDRVVVFAADDSIRPVGADVLGPADDARRGTIRRALSELRSGGATDLGAVLERAADALPAGSDGTLLYVGDGWPTLGDATVDAIRTRLSRRAGGLPRLGAVAVGPTANRFGLTALVRGSGPVLGIDDRDAAAQVAVTLLAEALRPSIAGALVDLGPDVERIYPRGGLTVRAGDTLTVVGRTRARPPSSVTVRYRQGGGIQSTFRTLPLMPVVNEDDIRRRWSGARVEEVILSGGGREAVVDAALRNGLLTPWTGWAVGAGGGSFKATPLAARVLDAGLDGNLAVFSARFATRPPTKGALTPPRDDPWPTTKSPFGDAIKSALESSARRRLDEAMSSVRQCRDSRTSLRPEVGGALQVRLTVGGDGRVREAVVRGATAFDDDASLDRCVELVIRSLQFYVLGGGSVVSLSYEFHLPPAQDTTVSRCSPTSTLPAAMRRGVWFERLHRPDSAQNPLGSRGERAYFYAKGACETPTWADRRTFLELLLVAAGSGPARVDLARLLDEGGDVDAGSLVRREAVRRVETPEELLQVRQALLANEPDVGVPFVRAYSAASTNDARLGVVRGYLELSPHDSRLRRKELSLLEALGRKDEVVGLALGVRSDPFLDAGLLADAASTLRRAGSPEEARRTFGELAERAPEIPFARAYLGDRLLDEGLDDEAAVAYEALLRLAPDDPAASLRLALAHAGAGRLDIALRLLSHVTETGGRTSDPALAELASIVSLDLIGEARAKKLGPDEDERLRRRALDVPVPDVAALVLVRAPTWMPGLAVRMLRGAKGTDSATAPLRAASLGLAGLTIERGEGAFRLKVGRQADLAPGAPAVAHVSVLVFGRSDELPQVVTKDVALRTDGDEVEVGWSGSAFL